MNCCTYKHKFLCSLLTTAEDLANADVQEVTVNLGFLFSPPSFVGFLARPDNVTENEECLVVELSVNEEELEDERDRGQVDFVRNVALIRIREIGIFKCVSL